MKKIEAIVSFLVSLVGWLLPREKKEEVPPPACCSCPYAPCNQVADECVTG